MEIKLVTKKIHDYIFIIWLILLNKNMNGQITQTYFYANTPKKSSCIRNFYVNEKGEVYIWNGKEIIKFYKNLKSMIYASDINYLINFITIEHPEINIVINVKDSVIWIDKEKNTRYKILEGDFNYIKKADTGILVSEASKLYILDTLFNLREIIKLDSNKNDFEFEVYENNIYIFWTNGENYFFDVYSLTDKRFKEKNVILKLPRSMISFIGIIKDKYYFKETNYEKGYILEYIYVMNSSYEVVKTYSIRQKDININCEDGAFPTGIFYLYRNKKIYMLINEKNRIVIKELVE